MTERSLRGHLLRLLLLPISLVLIVSSVAAYYLAIEPATEAHDASLIDAGLALSHRVSARDGEVVVDLPSAAEQVLRTDPTDNVYYVVRDPSGERVAGDAGIPLEDTPATRDRPIFYDAEYRGVPVRAATLLTPCGRRLCAITIAETTRKRDRLVREILLGSVLPQALIAALTIVIVWFGVARGLAPLRRLSDEIRRRSPRDLQPIDVAAVPSESRPLIEALNGLLQQVTEGNRNQQRFLANAAHQLRTPLAGLQAHTELALSLPMPDACRTQVGQVHQATIRTARLANQLLALARAEPGGHSAPQGRVDLKTMVEGAADEWVHRALERDLDLGFDLEGASVRGDEFLLREALANLLHNAIEYSPRGARVTVRTGSRDERPFFEVEDEGPGIPVAERERVLERFYRVPGTPGTGSGLGLAVVREIAAAHSAAIRIGDGVGARGARVALTFPNG